MEWGILFFFAILTVCLRVCLCSTLTGNKSANFETGLNSDTTANLQKTSNFHQLSEKIYTSFGFNNPVLI
jgi:hypothetical protein